MNNSIYSRNFGPLNTKSICFGIICSFLSVSVGCEDFVEVDVPITEISRESAYSDDKTATSVVTGMYGRMVRTGPFNGGRRSITLNNALLSDELENFSQAQEEFAQNSLNPESATVSSMWSFIYSIIYTSNDVLEGLIQSDDVSEEIKQQLEGEARFVRAFCYFNLVNLFGEIPLYNTTDFEVNRRMARAEIDEIYALIEEDLLTSISLLSENYVSENKARPNLYTAASLLSRVYLFLEEWEMAENMASEVINSGNYSLELDINSVFLLNSPETIWQLFPVTPNRNTEEAAYFILTASPIGSRVALSEGLLNSFEPGDMRRQNWVGSFTSGTDTWFYPFKYKIPVGSQEVSEASIFFRLAEQYLIRAESRVLQGDLIGALNDLNLIRNRAGLPNFTSSNSQEILDAIYAERRVEFFVEKGQRWYELKRTGQADAILSDLKGSNWQSFDVLLPIPQQEILNNSNITQNEGY